MAGYKIDRWTERDLVYFQGISPLFYGFLFFSQQIEQRDEQMYANLGPTSAASVYDQLEVKHSSDHCTSRQPAALTKHFAPQTFKDISCPIVKMNRGLRRLLFFLYLEHVVACFSTLWKVMWRGMHTIHEGGGLCRIHGTINKMWTRTRDDQQEGEERHFDSLCFPFVWKAQNEKKKYIYIHDFRVLIRVSTINELRMSVCISVLTDIDGEYFIRHYTWQNYFDLSLFFHSSVLP